VADAFRWLTCSPLLQRRDNLLFPGVSFFGMSNLLVRAFEDHAARLTLVSPGTLSGFGQGCGLTPTLMNRSLLLNCTE
jgi:hypothetical protein